MSNIPLIERITAVLEGSWVDRWHNIRTLRRENVAEHSHNMLVLGYMLFGSRFTPALARAVTFHDAGHERFMGDWPWDAKRPLTDGRGAAIEHAGALQLHQRLGIMVELTSEEKDILHFLDCLDAVLYLREEVRMGNTLVRERMNACLMRLTAMPEARAASHVWQETVALIDCPVADECTWYRDMIHEYLSTPKEEKL